MDPWFESEVFNHSWSLLHEDREVHLEMLDPTDIWLSHEHPDHFNIPTLLRIPLERRPFVTVHVRQTQDNRVQNWCKQNGFRVSDSKSGEPFMIGDDIELTIYPIGIEDSASLTRVGGVRLLNLNDCLFFSDRSLKNFARKVGHVDYVSYICGYAEGGGSRVDATFREHLFRLHMQRFVMMKDAFPNSKIIGFAAFKHFSHFENCFQNDRISFSFIRDLVLEYPNVFAMLAPGDELTRTSLDQSLKACDFWEQKLKAAKPVSVSSRSIEIDVLVKNAKELVGRIKSIGSFWLRVGAGLPGRLRIQPLLFHVVDHNLVLKLSLIGESVQLIKPAQQINPDKVLRVHSEALNHSLTYDFGLSTLMISGRFESADATRAQLHRWSVLSLLNAAGEKLRPKFFARNAGRIVRNL